MGLGSEIRNAEGVDISFRLMLSLHCPTACAATSAQLTTQYPYTDVGGCARAQLGPKMYVLRMHGPGGGLNEPRKKFVFLPILKCVIISYGFIPRVFFILMSITKSSRSYESKV